MYYKITTLIPYYCNYITKYNIADFLGKHVKKS